ncbi:MAG: SDR family NAD(P)-dependent oxidoreductase [Halanaerobiales bacterium]|nr:SDR family NAD(P)-dependent oxidoreductase [Halanaerobiales bacterium]
MKLKNINFDLNLSQEPVKQNNQNDIAIIGMDCNIGYTDNIWDLWRNIKSGTDMIGTISPVRKRDTDDIISCLIDFSDKYKYLEMCYLRDLDKFDYDFFGISPREAELMDPSQRLLLQSAYKTFEDAGLGAKNLEGSNTGVFVGYSNNELYSYKSIIYQSNQTMYNMAIPGNHSAVIAGRLATYFDLCGPTFVCDTACSSSLVAFHLACQSLRNKESEMAFVGAVSYALIPIRNKNFAIGIKSSSSRTRAFDNLSDGTGVGEGVVSLLLKPLDKALLDGNPIYAVVKGSAMNHDGRSSSLTSPNSLAQKKVLQAAWKQADISPETIEYIEAHGTGTRIGDPIEIEAIRRAFDDYTDKKQFCAISSVKSNIGHLDSAAGLAGIIKAVMSLNEGVLAPTLHFESPNSQIHFIDSPVYVNDKLKKWDSSSKRCGVSSFGISGTNCHVILEEFQHPEVKTSPQCQQNIITFSAESRTALHSLLESYIEFIDLKGQMDIFKLCYTANCGRTHYKHRIAMIVESIKDLNEKIKKVLQNQTGLENVYYSDNHQFKKEELENPNQYKGVLSGRYKVESREQLTSRLQELCSAYVTGTDIPWLLCYYPGVYRKIHIPTYNFDKKRCWLKEVRSVNRRNSEVINQEYAYKKIWERVNQVVEESEIVTEDQLILIFSDERGIWKRIEHFYHAKGAEVVTVHPRIGYTLDDYVDILDKLKIKRIAKIIHMASIENGRITDSIANLEGRLEKGLYSLYYLYHALFKCRIDVKQIVILSNNADKVTGREEYVVSSNNALYAFAKSMQAELSTVKIRCIDLSEDLSEQAIINEVLSKDEYFKIALRDVDQRYVEVIAHADIKGYQQKPIVDGGIYLVTGGLGDMGLQICRGISKKYRLTFYLVNRDVDKHLTEEKRTIIQDIEKNGCIVRYLSADISQEKDVIQNLEYIRVNSGKINGILHCAGVEGQGLIVNKTIEEIQQVLRPKVHGTLLLHKYTEEDDLDLFVIFSSLAALISHPGQSDYAATNAFMDSYAEMIRKSNVRCIVINWSAFLETGMAVRNNVDFESGSLSPLKTSEVIEWFFNILAGTEDQVIIAKPKKDVTDLGKYALMELSDSIRRDDYKLDVAVTKEECDEEDEDFYNQEIYQNYTDTQKQIAYCWYKVLGYSCINLNDDFYELGGNSLTAVNLIVSIEESFNIKFPIEMVQQILTVREMSEYIDGVCSTEQNESREPEVIHPEMHVIENINPFKNFVFKNCFYNALFSVMTSFGISVNKFLCNYIPVYRVKDDKLFVEYLTESTISEVLEGCGLRYRIDCDDNDIVKTIKSAIEEKRPVIVSVDCYYLPLREDTYLKQHLEHSILIYGFDDSNQSFKIIEQKNSMSLSYQKLTISYRDLEIAYKSYLSLYKNDQRITYADFYSDNNSAPHSLENYLHLFNKYKEQVFAGLKILQQYVSDIVLDMNLILKDETTYNRLLEMLNAIFSAKAVETGLIKEVFPEDDSIKELIDQVHKQWSQIRIKLVKCHLLKNKKDFADLKLDQLLQRACNSEEEFYQILAAQFKEHSKEV